MCGLAGFIHFKEAEQLAKQANKCQAHRGPDHSASWISGNVALIHQRLSIIDLSERSNQPFQKNGMVIIFNGEIYNYKDIKARLLNEGDISFITTGDTEVVLEAWRKWGAKCFDHLIGMFSFAIFDEQTKQLILARDHFGIKPLFYTRIDNSFAFASELKTLTNIPGFNKTLNSVSLIAAMNYLWVPGNETMFKDTFKLPAAHYIIIDTNSSSLSLNPVCYWKLDTNVVYDDEQTTIGKLDECMQESIKRHMVADVPVSSFLSGGLDSSLISVMAAKLNPCLSTYTIGTSETDKKVEQMPDDEKYAKQLADKFGFDHNEIIINADILTELPHIVYTLDEPIGDPAAINTYLICKAARKKGVKVLLSGMGADEIFFGYRRQKAVLIANRYKKLPGIFRAPLAFVSKFLPLKIGRRGIRITRWLKRFLSFASLPSEEAYMRSYSYYNKDELSRLFKADISPSYSALREMHKSHFEMAYKNDLVNQMCYTDIQMFMQGLNLTYSDRASMATSVEVRVPFIDREVISLAMKINGSLKYKNGESKYILKKTAQKYLPHEIIYRPKASFGAPIRSWISGELKGLIDETLSKEKIENRGLFKYDYVKQLIERDRQGMEDNAYRIYQLLTFELWCTHFLDK